MLAQLRANVWLLVLTLLLCSVGYPLALWAVGQTVFRDQAEGSLITGTGGQPIASRLIAHEIKGEQYFQPRPSAAGYNGAASGASNYAASNPALRDRVARSLAALARYGKGPRQGEPVAPDIVRWYRVKLKDTANAPAIKDATDETEIAAACFDLWRAVHPDVALEDVPADLVLASASGLDPHLTLAGALYQLPRVAGNWAELTGRDRAAVQREIDALVRQHAHTPRFGVALVNVVEVNIALQRKYSP